MSEQSLEFNWMPGISTSRTVAEKTQVSLHITVPGPGLHTVHRQHTERTFLGEIYVMEPEPDEDEEVDPADLAPCICVNTPIITIPASEDEEVAGEITADGVEEVIQGLEELTQEIKDNDEDENVDDVLEKLEKSQELLREIMDIMSSISEDTSSRQHTVVPNVDVWDTGKAIEQEYRLHPDPTMKEVRDRLSNQVWDLLQILQERVDQHTYNSKDIELISGLKTISVLNSRLSVITDTVLKSKAEKP